METKDFWNDLPASNRKDIEAALIESDKGELIPHEEVMKKMRVKYLR
jgi:predicted transcriptional regulator